MTWHEVVFTPEAEEQLAELYRTVDEKSVSIIGVFHGGRDYETALQTDQPEDSDEID